MIKEIKYEGYTEVPSDYECPDGDLALAQGVLPDDGTLKPILPATDLAILPAGYKIVFIHATSQMAHYIIHRPSNGEFFWIDKSVIDDAPSHPVTITTSDLTHVSESFSAPTYYSINAVGNTLMVADEDGIHYNLWTAPNYHYLGTHLPETKLQFMLEAEMGCTEELEGVFNPAIPAAEWFGNGATLSEENQRRVSDDVMGNVNKFIQNEAVKKGKFVYPFFVRYAYRLYDQTLAMHSAPVLMVCASDCAPMVGITTTETGDYDNSLEVIRYRVMSGLFTLHYKVLSGSASLAEMGKWKDIIKSVDVFISAPVYTYDKSGKIENIYVSLQDGINPFCIANHVWKFPLDVNPRFTGYVKQTFKRMYDDEIYALYPDNPHYMINGYIKLPRFSEEQVKTKIKDVHDFYKLSSLSPMMVAGDAQALPIEDDYLSSLVAREVMTDDYDSHDSLIPSYMFNYNSRLNLAGLSKSLFDGFRLDTMVTYMGGVIPAGYIPEFDPGPELQSEVYVHIQQDGKEIVVKNDEGTIAQNHPLLMLYYPNPDAVKMTVKIGNSYFVYNLERHDFLSGAYYFEGFNPTAIQPQTTPTASADKTISMPNVIYTSEVNNPYLFPASGINTVGIGRILGMAAATKALSEGQFGEFPLYAFTTEGVWALQFQNDGVIIARHPVTRDVVIDPAVSITSIDTAVLFATERGIMLLQGSNTKCISEELETQKTFNLIEIKNGAAVYPGGSALTNIANVNSDAITIPDIKEFVKDCRMLYDYKNQRVIVYSPSDKCVLAYNLKTKKWGMLNGTISSGINSYPEALVMTKEGNNYVLTNFSELDTSATVKGLVVTRPLKLDYPNDLKTIRNVIQRGKFAKGHVKQALWGSRDLINWYLVGSSVDHYLHDITGTPYKYFRLGLALNLVEGETLYGCTIEYELKETNKLR